MINTISCKTKFSFFGLLIVIVSITIYLLGVIIAPFRHIPGLDFINSIAYFLVWYSGLMLLIGFSLILFEIFNKVKYIKSNKEFKGIENPNNYKVVVGLTAFNDEESIAQSVVNFLENKNVESVLVVDNNSCDNTFQLAHEAGATVITEKIPGYGSCVYRVLEELAKVDSEFVVICEGDMTFRAEDISKLIAYANNCDVVMGTRICDQLQSPKTQLSIFMHFGNFFVGKLLESKYLGSCNITDVGCTFKLFRRRIILDLLKNLNRNINLEFNAHLLEVLISSGYCCVEVPITFHQRYGFSKGGNRSNYAAIKVGLAMIIGIIFGWKRNEKLPTN